MATGNKGRFAERLKKIALFKRKKIIVDSTEENQEYKSFYNVLKVAAAIPGLVYESLIVDKTKDNKKIEEKKQDIIDSSTNEMLIDEVIKNEKIKTLEKSNNNVNVVDDDENKKEIESKEKTIIKKIESILKKEALVDTKIEEIRKLEKKIIDTIKKDLIKMANELEIDESELFILEQIYSDEAILDKCRKNLNSVKNLIYKIDILKNRYTFLRDDYDFEYVLEYNNSSLIDDIIDLKRMVNEEELKAVSNEYKLLKIFESQYFVLEKIHNEAYELEEKIQVKEENLKNRDIDFKKLQDKVYNISDVDKKYRYFVTEQQEIIDKINRDLEKIGSKEVIDKKLIGFNKLLSNSFKYMGLLMMSPLRGIFPGIAMQTAITKNVIGNLRQNLHVEEKRRLEYFAIDCSKTLSSVMDDLSVASSNIDLTLEEIVNLKVEYNDKFKKYQNDFSQYREVIEKINDMENKLLGSKLKVEIMKSRVKKKEEINAKKLKLVHDMNKQQEKN